MLPAPTEPSEAEVREIAAAHDHLEGPLLPILHALQERFGHVAQSALPVIADALNISRADVHGVVSFYHDFRDRPAGRHVVRVCRAEACQAAGGDAVADAAKAQAGVDWHGTTPDGRLTLEPVYCLGLCACGPAVMVDGRLHGRVDAGRLRALMQEVAT